MHKDAEVDLESFASLQLLQSEHRKVVRRYNELKQERLELEDIIKQAARASFSAMDPPPVPPPKKDRRSRGEEVAIVTCADWQLGRITPDYDSDICEARIQAYARKVLSITEVQRADHPVKHARIWLLGDLVDGEQVFPGQPWEIDSSLVDQIITNGARMIRDFVTTMLGAFESVHVVGIVGNHGRIGRPGQFHPNTNADRMLYLVAREWYVASQEPRVTWEIPTHYRGDRGWYHVDQIGEYKALLVHGDQFRGGNSFAGLPFYSFANKALKWRDMSLLDDMPGFDDVWCGHWHRITRVPVGSMNVRVCGTPMSTDPWSIETLAASARPAQYLAFVHPKDGIVTAEYEVLLT